MKKGEKRVYPVVFEKLEDGYLVYVPDFEINTQGEDLADAMDMARDAISLAGMAFKDDLGRPLPEPSAVCDIEAAYDGADVLLIDVDFAAYRRKYDQRSVRVNVTMPSWLNEAAKEAGLNVSAVLQGALKKELDLDKYVS
ncbi:MAG: HicB family protein [Chloroflexi bacterium]|nr:HicB family protein [Chloroflexota bacterium]